MDANTADERTLAPELLAAAADLATPADRLAELAQHPQLKPFRRAGASSDLAGYAPPDRALDPAALAWLAAGGTYARKLAARHPHTPPELLERLAGDPDRVVRQFVGKNSAASIAALTRLAADGEADVRQAVARNPATPPALLERLAADAARNVSWNVARHPRTPLEALERLAGDVERAVRQAVARNPATPPALLERLAADAHPAVRAMAARNPHTPAALRAAPLAEQGAAPRDAPATEPAVFASQPQPAPNSPIIDLADWASRDPAARARLATTPGLAPVLLRQLAEDDHPSVRAAVARNPDVSPELLAWLADDESLIVHRAVAENRQTPTELLERFAQDYSWANARVRLAVLAHPQVTPAILERLAGDLSVEVRRAVMNHRLTPASARARILASSLDMCIHTSEAFYHALALARELSMLNPARLDWQAHLWRYVVQTPTDFQDFDRRFIGRGLYLESLASESVRVFVAVDTSGSVDDRQIRALVAEVQGILSAYPHVICDLYYADAEAHGPYELTAHGDVPTPIGGGGTDFRPFFAAVAERYNPHEQSACVYLTDGYGDFPAEPPEIPVLWVVTAGGKSLDAFPFGEAVRLLES